MYVVGGIVSRPPCSCHATPLSSDNIWHGPPQCFSTNAIYRPASIHLLQCPALMGSHYLRYYCCRRKKRRRKGKKNPSVLCSGVNQKRTLQTPSPSPSVLFLRRVCSVH